MPTITVKSRDTSSFTVEWDEPTGDYTGYVVSRQGASGSEQVFAANDDREAVFEQLTPGTLHTVVVSIRSGDQASEDATNSFYTGSIAMYIAYCKCKGASSMLRG